jgi:hypothetical protein
MILENFTMLGKTAPERQSDDRMFVCSAGIDPSIGLVRIYPLATSDAPKRWSRNQIRLTKNPKDSRPESFQIDGDRDGDNHSAINRMFTQVGTSTAGQLAPVIERSTTTSIVKLNEARRSLAFVPLPASSSTIEWREDQRHPNHPQTALDLDVPGEGPIGEVDERSAFTPILRFDLEDGEHRLTIRDWGAYEFMRKGHDRDGLHKALDLHRDRLLLIGNHNRHRNAWLVISVLPPVDGVAGMVSDQLSLVAA